MWLQNFFLFSLVWAFGSVLKLNLRSEFESHIRSKVVVQPISPEKLVEEQLAAKGKMRKQLSIVSPDLVAGTGFKGQNSNAASA